MSFAQNDFYQYEKDDDGWAGDDFFSDDEQNNVADEQASQEQERYLNKKRKHRLDIASLAITDVDLERIYAECSRGRSSVVRATPEQVQLLRYRPRFGQRVIVQAFAGGGKTTLCRMLAERLQPLRVLYVAYNRMAATDAKRDMPENVDARTIHSLALNYLGGGSSCDLASVPPQPIGLTDQRALASFEEFCRDPRRKWPSHGEAREAWQAMLDGRAPFTYDAMLKKLTLDGKKSRLWLSMNYDVLIVDEAQDSQPTFVDWFERIDDLLIYAVGDRFQSIYSFNGTVNAMQSLRDDLRLASDDEDDGESSQASVDEDSTDHVDEDESQVSEDESVFYEDEQEQLLTPVALFSLSRSFRFGSNIGKFASDILRRAALYPAEIPQHATIVQGYNGNETKIKPIGLLANALGDNQGPIYILGRQNANLIKHALRFQAQRENARIAFFGNAANIMNQLRESYLQPMEWRKQELERLRKKFFGHREDPDIVPPLDEWEKQRYSALRTVEREPESIVRALLAKTVFEEEDQDDVTSSQMEADTGNENEEWHDEQAEWFVNAQADVHYGTVHSSKGLEFDRVAILDDMVPLDCACRWLQASKSNPDLMLPSVLRASVGRPQYGVTARDQVREEVHLCYVAVTRVKKELYLEPDLFEFANRAQSSSS